MNDDVGKGNLLERKRHLLSEMGIRLRSSWFHAEAGFEPVQKAFFERPDLFRSGEVIWKTRNKSVRKVILPEEYGGITLAFKESKCVKPFRYLLRCSKNALEAVNYHLFSALGIPMATLLFAGEERVNFHLKHSFLATRFAKDYLDGRVFLPGGSLRGSKEQKRFIRQNLAFLARLHALHWFHKGARVFNFLWKPVGTHGEIDIVWIDVASCRVLAVPDGLFRKYMIRDLADFFRDLALNDEELCDALNGYLAHNPRCGMTQDSLFRRVKAAANRPR